MKLRTIREQICWQKGCSASVLFGVKYVMSVDERRPGCLLSFKRLDSKSRSREVCLHHVSLLPPVMSRDAGLSCLTTAIKL